MLPSRGHKEPVQHYTAYRPKPLGAEERKNVTLLFGGLTWKHERLIQGAFENMGYKAQPLPNISRADLDAGKELIDTGACCPTIFTTGNLARHLKEVAQTEGIDNVTQKYIFLTAGACGPCRFGQYHESYSMALDGIGMTDFRLFLLDQANLDQGAKGGGIEVNLPFSMGTIWSILVADLLTDLEYQTRPFEIVAGSTDRVTAESVEFLYTVFRDRPLRRGNWNVAAWHLFGNYFTKALGKVKKKWDQIEVDRLRVKPRVKITGEFWLQTHEGDGNYNIKRWLESEGAEVIPPPIAVWLDYLIALEETRLQDKLRAGDRSAARKIRSRKLARAILRWSYNRLRKALGNVPQPLVDQRELKELAAPYYSYRLDGGEGHMLVGKALWAYKHKHAHMVCELSPYSCMPNTMSIGAMANVTGRYPDLLYAPIEIKGDAEVHAYSRCQMVLTEAKNRAAMEFETTLARTGLSMEAARRRIDARPELKRATFCLPHGGVAGVAANTLIYLGKMK